MAAPRDGESDQRKVTLGHRLEYVLVRMLAFVLRSTDVHGATRIGAALGRLLGLVDRRHRRVCDGNLQLAYGDAMSAEERTRVMWEVYENIGMTAAEFVHGPRRLRGKARARWMSVTGAEELNRERDGGPAIFLSAHFGNWEQAPAAASLEGIRVTSVARPLDNPLLDRWVIDLRTSTGNEVVMKQGALRELIRVARRGRSIAILVDQNAGRHGKVVPFFGQPVSTFPTGIALAKRLGAPVTVGHIERLAPGRHRLHLGAPFRVGEDEGGEDEALAEVNRQIEA
ncbi:MAG: lysophospholipid acyltransferase family protein, partial [Planctomycetota bacterium]